MKNIKLLVLVVLTSAIVSSCGLSKMMKKYEAVDYTVTPEVLENLGGEVEFEVNGFIPEKFFHNKAIVEFKPVLKYDGGEKELKSFTLKGEKAEGNGTVINKKEGGSFTYKTSFAYEKGMEDAVVVINPVATLKKKTEELGSTDIVEGIIITSTRIKHTENTIAAAHQYEKETIISESANIYFAKNLSYLNWRLKLNTENQNKEQLETLKEFIRKGWVIKDVDMNAWASPEGEISFNEDLAQDRAKTGEKYMRKMLKTIGKEKDSKVQYESADDVTIDSNPRGEDWNGFMTAVENSNLEEKNTILNVVRSQSDLKERENEIRNMSLIYNELAQDILPKLRRVEFTVNAFEPKHTDEELMDLIFSYPDTLDIKEKLYAATLQLTAEKKIAAYKVINEKHANCWKAFNNKAVVYLSQDDIANAEESLNKANSIKSGGEIYNNMAALEIKKENFEKAVEYINKAKSAGINTKYNQGLVDMINGDFASAESNFAAANCDYNLALAQLMNNKAEKAIATLECADKGAAEYYLLAVIYARQANETNIISNLEKAIAIDPAYKNTAKKDKEFIKLFDKEAFQALVK